MLPFFLNRLVKDISFQPLSIPFTLKEIDASLHTSTALYKYTFWTQNGPDHLDLNLSGKNFNLKLKKSIRSPSWNSLRVMCLSCQHLVCSSILAHSGGRYALSSKRRAYSPTSLSSSTDFSPIKHNFKGSFEEHLQVSSFTTYGNNPPCNKHFQQTVA